MNPFRNILKIVGNCLQEHVYTSDYDRDDEKEMQMLDLFISDQQNSATLDVLANIKQRSRKWDFEGL